MGEPCLTVFLGFYLMESDTEAWGSPRLPTIQEKTDGTRRGQGSGHALNKYLLTPTIAQVLRDASGTRERGKQMPPSPRGADAGKTGMNYAANGLEMNG